MRVRCWLGKGHPDTITGCMTWIAAAACRGTPPFGHARVMRSEAHGRKKLGNAAKNDSNPRMQKDTIKEAGTTDYAIVACHRNKDV